MSRSIRAPLCLFGLVAFITSAVALRAHASAPVSEKPPVAANSDELTAAQTANGHFAVDMYRELAKGQPGQNLFFSPFSISSALTIAIEGAVGETADQMGKALGFPANVRNQGANAATLPWKTVTIHKGQAALNDRFNQPEASQATRDKIAKLKSDLNAANQRTQDLQKAGKYADVNKSTEEARAIADQLNKLYKEVDQYELRVANALWGEKTYPFRQPFLDATRTYYGSTVFSVDFHNRPEPARLEINAWVEKQTKDRIKNLVPAGAVDDNTRLVITNAVYFKGEWETPFEDYATKEETFTLADGSQPKSAMMNQYNTSTASYAAFNADGTPFKTPKEIPQDMRRTDPSLYPDAHGFAMLSLPYKGKKLSLAILVPQSADGIAKMEQKLSHDNLQAWDAAFQRRTVELAVPKFKMETVYELTGALQNLGMVRAFKNPIDPAGAQFDGMTASQDPTQKLYVGAILHKTFVEVNEKGTEAAAATAIVFPSAAAMPEREPVKMVPFIPIFRADKPFLFLIRDTSTGSILFLGRIMNPKS